MNRSVDPSVHIEPEELRIAARVASVRFSESEVEQSRLTLVDELLRVESNLGRVLSEHARHMLSESRGSHSTWDIVADTEEMCAALREYEAVVRRVAAIYGPFLAALRASDTGSMAEP